MERRKDILNEYKQRTLTGGVYRISNTVNGKYILGHTFDMGAMQNRFNFSLSSNSCIHPRMQEDWKEHGSKAFEFAVLESIEMKKEQGREEFLEDLKTLEGIWRSKLGAGREY